MQKVSFGALFLFMLSCICGANENKDPVVAIEMPEDFLIATIIEDRSVDSIAGHNVYLEAYIQGCLDARFPRSGVVVTVRNGDVILSNLPKNQDKADTMVTYVANFVADSSKGDLAKLHVIANREESKKKSLETSAHDGMWLPQSTILYPSELANPHRVCFSGAVRLHDSVAGQTSTPVSFGDQFPLYRWSNVNIWKFNGDMQLEIEGDIFAIFNQTHSSTPLINADYYVAIPLTYAYEDWAHRLRIYHISSHLGDEYLGRRDHAKRLNKSFEAIDYSAAYFITKDIKLYGTAGAIGHSDSEMHLKPLYGEYGMEVKCFRHDWRQLYGVPYLAMHFENWQDNDWKIDATFALGYEWGKINGMGKRIRVSLEYHSGYSDAGQFSRRRDDYVQAKLSYGF